MKKVVQNQKKMYFIDRKFKEFLRMRFAFVYRQNLFIKQKFIFNFFFFSDLKNYWIKNFFFLKSLNFKKNNFFYSSILPFFFFEKQFLFKKIDLNNFLLDNNIFIFFDKKNKGSDFLLSSDLNFIKNDTDLNIFFKKFDNKYLLLEKNFELLNNNFFFLNNNFFFLNILEIYKIFVILYLNLVNLH